MYCIKHFSRLFIKSAEYVMWVGSVLCTKLLINSLRRLGFVVNSSTSSIIFSSIFQQLSLFYKQYSGINHQSTLPWTKVVWKGKKTEWMKSLKNFNKVWINQGTAYFSVSNFVLFFPFRFRGCLKVTNYPVILKTP